MSGHLPHVVAECKQLRQSVRATDRLLLLSVGADLAVRVGARWSRGKEGTALLASGGRENFHRF
jgi:hypothetical protein